MRFWSRIADAKLGKSLEMFNNKKRKARKPPAWFRWSNTMRNGA